MGGSNFEVVGHFFFMCVYIRGYHYKVRFMVCGTAGQPELRGGYGCGIRECVPE